MVNQYQVIIVDLEPKMGNEKEKKRPCLVISNTKINKVTRFAWVLPITSRKLKYPTDVTLKTKNNVVNGIIDCTQIRALNLKARPFKIVDELENTVINQVKDVLLNNLQLIITTSQSIDY